MYQKGLKIAKSRFFPLQKLDKKGQITIFIILGIVLLIAITLFILFKQEIVSFKPEQLPTTEKGKVEQYITARSYLSEQRKRQLRELTVYVGMAKEEVRLLVEEPVEITRDLARMAELARNYWSEFNNQITEAWVYKAYVWESTYALYFRDDVLMAVTEFYWELL